jgi:hypothetical protein
VPPLPIAAFLTGSLLTIVLPLAVLLALATWYWIFISRLPDPVEGAETHAAGPVTDPVSTGVTAGPGDAGAAGAPPAGGPDVTTPPGER